MKTLHHSRFFALAALLFSFAANSASVQVAPSSSDPTIYVATGISGLIVDGTTYNVSFIKEAFLDIDESAFPWFGDEATTSSVAGSILDALNGDIRSIGYVGSDSDAHAFVFAVPWAYSQVALYRDARGLLSYGGIKYPTTSWVPSIAPVAENTNYFAAYATFNVVPIPAALWLFGSALVGLGWMRRML